MTYYVLAFPQLSALDNQCIQNIRQAYDPQFRFLEPHITIAIFPKTNQERLFLVKDIPLHE